LYILIFSFLVNETERKRFLTKWQQTLPKFNLLLISSWISFWVKYALHRKMFRI
jgi:hypothetical protein